MIVDVRAGLRAFLLADSGISTLVGGDRIYPVILKQGETRPSVVYSRASGQGDYHMEGPSGLVRARVQIDALSLVSLGASTLGDMIKNRIDGASGVWLYGADSPQESVKVQGVFFESERDTYSDANKMFGLSRDYFIWYAER